MSRPRAAGRTPRWEPGPLGASAVSGLAHGADGVEERAGGGVAVVGALLGRLFG
ncbi:hypothetical protein [Actinocorallia sp. A-T 12471]|uniref:hypothetical protein n=1 Tax=Actinocorallia sp. A-T 12471 TaxID=3089813 RepID=UPI0029D277A4|nr:hypothetical protein [Actinocorallia sp. A-T 12471]MDX6740326.1 hypothetical protein [Actinocorallia sp. A-T 12471]